MLTSFMPVVRVLGRFSGLSPWARASNLLLPMAPCDIRDDCVRQDPKVFEPQVNNLWPRTSAYYPEY
jgi:hypothetical protein